MSKLDFQLRVHDFNLDKICKNPTIILNAKRGSGKSICIKHLIYHFGNKLKYPVGIICSKSEKVAPFYQNFFPDLFIYDDCQTAFNKVLTRQKNIAIKNKKRKTDGKKLIDSRLLLVLDDVISNAKEWSNSPAMKEIMFNGRHYDITMILAVQDTVAVPPSARNNFDYIFLFNNDIENEIEKIYKMYAGIFSKKGDFKEVLKTVTEDYGILVIIRRDSISNQLEDKIARFKANINLIPNMFGSEKFKMIHKKRYNHKWEEEELNAIEKFGPSAGNIKFMKY